MPSDTVQQNQTPPAKMISSSVNKTSLHPGGVEYVHRCCVVAPSAGPYPGHTQLHSKHVIADRYVDRPQREHTEIEEELHEIAHIDYDRVAIVSDSSLLRCGTIADSLTDCQSFSRCTV